jgi:alkylhydroperoxidase/carboxymuconolactone decarboxylase family protein YurZ
MSVDKLATEAFSSISGDTPVLDTLLQMQSDIQARSGLDDRTYLLVRIAALVALDASASSYLLNFALADEVGVTADEVRGVLIALAPVVGSVRTVNAADRAMQAINSS